MKFFSMRKTSTAHTVTCYYKEAPEAWMKLNRLSRMDEFECVSEPREPYKGDVSNEPSDETFGFASEYASKSIRYIPGDKKQWRAHRARREVKRNIIFFSRILPAA